MSFLEMAVASARSRLARLPSGQPSPRPFPRCFAKALAGRSSVSVIAELKRSSPSRGAIALDIDAAVQAMRYARAGAAAISVLTEPDYFGGCLGDLADVAHAVDVPVLMKDFFISPEQVRVAALLGASAFLVVLRVVDDTQLTELLAAGCEYGLTPLLEVHDERELARALPQDGVIGVNNRDLDTLEIDRKTAPRLARLVPPTRIIVAESGYLEPCQVGEIRKLVDAVLIGSALMTNDDPSGFLSEVQGCE